MSSGPHGHPAAFATTHWSVILRAGAGAEPVAAEALARLCETYRSPVLAHIRHLGSGPSEAEDLTQGFFAHFLKASLASRVKPRTGVKFRSYLLRCLKHFLADQHDRNQALKRGGGIEWVPLDEPVPESNSPFPPEPAAPDNPVLLFDRAWAAALLDHVLDRLEGEYRARGRGGVFARLEPWLLDRKPDEPQATLALQLGMSEDAVKKEISRLRARYRDLFREEVAQTVSSPPEVQEEIDYLFAILSR
ncbi:MAG: sigma-70 family RNA polymerase sigma factor [Verrucomicrobia bacterium]|nr:sigma-70 family RNA polymerase sigma factor [Verrucomicrobiota bacterium]